MLSYRHHFHAGNHADVLKHITLVLVIEALKAKEKGFFLMDTHAGAGRYQLQRDTSGRRAEFLDGIDRLRTGDAPVLLKPYLDLIAAFNPNSGLLEYPGSPMIASRLCRVQDRLVFSELHPTDFALLNAEFADNRRVTVVQEDGYRVLRAKLPPVERRGLVFMDPPYELQTEFDDVVDALKEGLRRWTSGIYAVWYPVVYRDSVNYLQRRIRALSPPKTLQIELCPLPDSNNRGLTGSGMLVINPPWRLEQQMRELLPWLCIKLSQSGSARYQLHWLVTERNAD